VKKSNSRLKKSSFSVNKILFFTLASMKKSRFGKEKPCSGTPECPHIFFFVSNIDMDWPGKA
jgi:hypothetical protein